MLYGELWGQGEMLGTNWMKEDNIQPHLLLPEQQLLLNTEPCICVSASMSQQAELIPWELSG